MTPIGTAIVRGERYAVLIAPHPVTDRDGKAASFIVSHKRRTLTLSPDVPLSRRLIAINSGVRFAERTRPATAGGEAVL